MAARYLDTVFNKSRYSNNFTVFHPLVESKKIERESDRGGEGEGKNGWFSSLTIKDNQQSIERKSQQ